MCRLGKIFFPCLLLYVCDVLRNVRVAKTARVVFRGQRTLNLEVAK